MNRPLHPTQNFDAANAFTELSFRSGTHDRDHSLAIYAQQPLSATRNGINYYGASLPAIAPTEPIRLLVMTSLRDVALEERIGNTFLVDGKETYRKGTLEALLESCREGALAGLVDVVAVVTDDYQEDLRGLNMPLTATESLPWIAPPSAENGVRTPLSALTVNIPSTFRRLRLSDSEGRAQAKLAFETNVAELAFRRGADVILSDHYLARLEFLIANDALAGHGRVLNIHPGITHKDHPLKCLGNAPDEIALQHARGYRWNAENNAWQNSSPSYQKAGASLHFVAEQIDAGSVLCDAELSKIDPTDSLELVQYKIYRDSKIPVLINGLAHYATSIYPYLNSGNHCSDDGADDFSSFAVSTEMQKFR